MSNTDNELKDLLTKSIGRLLEEKRQIAEKNIKHIKENEAKVSYFKTTLMETLKDVDWKNMDLMEAKKLLAELADVTAKLSKKI